MAGNKKKLLFISNIPAPYQVKFCYRLNSYFDTEFWFHEDVNSKRPAWWKIELGPRCKILNKVLFKNGRKYLALGIIAELTRFDPDIIILGGFLVPTNYVAYRWARRRGKRVVVLSKILRRHGKLRRQGLKTTCLELLYSRLDAVLTSNEEATKQLKKIFRILGRRVLNAQYPADIDDYFEHPVREKKSAYTYLFPNRLTNDYGPLLAIEIFSHIQNKFPGSRLRMNADGELLDKCKRRIRDLGLNDDVEFLTEIRNWNELHLVYRDSDILIFPAKFSNGNFTVIEAMASGMGIVISNRILGNVSMINNGINGYVCEPAKDEFLAAINQYIECPEKLKEHAIVNREFVRPYSCEATAELYWNLINQNVLH